MRNKFKGNAILVPDNGKNDLLADDKQFLSWVYERLVYVYHENENYDYMIHFKKIIDTIET